jgi:two-component system phosphate regulon sensor histidine kinase PhoR
VQTDIARIRSFVVATGVAVGLLGVATVAVLARRLTRPIADLTATTIAISEGDHSVRPSRSAVKELDALSQAITRLVDQMGNRLVYSERATETMEVVLGALPEGTVLIGSDGKVAYANPAAYQLLGVIPEEVTGLVPYAFQKAVRDSRETRAQAAQDVEHGKPARLLRGVTTPFVDDGRVLLMIADVTERERMATVRRDFVANASHELKTPVSSIVASAEALRIAVDKDQESARKFSRQIEDSALQLNRLVSDLLDLSRLEREKPVLDRLELHLVVAEEVERIRGRATEADIELETELQPVSVMGSRRDLVIAVRNLLENAIRYTHAGGRISVSVAEEGDEVVVSVADTGEGIPTRDHERVFERFYRVDTARSRGSGGTGLGLSIVKHVVESHGGEVRLESELGVGSTFRILLPAPRSSTPGTRG